MSTHDTHDNRESSDVTTGTIADRLRKLLAFGNVFVEAMRQDHAIKVRVNFTDDAGYAESLTSAATAAAEAEGPRAQESRSQEPLAQPTGLTGTVSHDEVSLSWDDPGDESVTGYQVLRRDKALHAIGEFLVHVENTGNADTTYVDETVEPETRYVYRIKARNAGGLSKRSEWFDANTPPEPEPEPTPTPDPTPEEPPSKPTGLTGTVSHDKVSLSWDNPGDGSITGYQILRRDKDLHAVGEFLVHVDDTGSDDTTYTDTDVEPSKRYVYRIKALNSAGLSKRSKWFDANTPA